MIRTTRASLQKIHEVYLILRRIRRKYEAKGVKFPKRNRLSG